MRSCLMTGCLFAAIGVVALVFALRAGCSQNPGPNRIIAGVVVDETGNPVPGAAVELSWSTGSGFDFHRASPQETEELTTDAEGRFRGRGGSHHCGVAVTKDGSYGTRLSVTAQMTADSLRIPLNRIRRPQPMVGKRVKLRLPVGSNRLQYDFMVGDCLPPLGQGVVADLEIEWTRPEVQHAEANRRAFTSRIIGEGNGLIPPPAKPAIEEPWSGLKSLHEAPLEGYEPSADFGNHFRGGNLVAYVKIRTGQPGGPLYGKLLDPLSYWNYEDYDRFEFEYVINPSGDRGLEMDMKKLTVPSRRELEYAPKMF